MTQTTTTALTVMKAKKKFSKKLSENTNKVAGGPQFKKPQFSGAAHATSPVATHADFDDLNEEEI